MERHYHIVIDDEKGHATTLRLHGLAEHAQSRYAIPTPAEAQASLAFTESLVESGELPRVNTKPGEALPHRPPAKRPDA